MSASPSHIELDSTRYRLYQRAQGHYKEWVESDIIRQQVEVGSSRPAEQPRPDIRTWRIDDWSAGEGYKILDSSQGHPSQRGYYGSQVINVRTSGQVSLGYDEVTSGSALAISGFAFVTHLSGLAIGGANIWVAAGASSYEQTALDTWTSRTTGVNTADDTIIPPITGYMDGIFVAATKTTAGGVRRVTSAGNTSWTSEESRAALAANNRIYWTKDGTTTTTLRRAGLDAAAAGTTMTTFNGVGSTYGGSGICSTAVGSRVYTLLVNKNEAPRLWVLENDVGREVAILDGLIIDIFTKSSRQYSRICSKDGIVYIGGYETLPNGTGVARLDYYDGQSWGTVWTAEGADGSAGTTPSEIVALAPGRKNEVLILTQGDAYRYDTRTGGVSRFWDVTSSTSSSSIAYHAGRYYYSRGGVTLTVGRTNTSGSGTYVSSATIDEPSWDYNLPDTEKLLTEIEVQTDTLASGATVEVQVVLDGSTITTDSAGATMSHASGTRTLFTVSGASTERTFRRIQPKILLKTSNTANTPVLLSVTLRCIPLATKLRKFEMLVDCTDESAVERKTGQQLSGRQIRTNLETLRDSTSNRVFTFTPLYKDSGKPFPAPTETQHVCIFEPGQENGVFEATGVGQGVMRVRLQKVG